jgi:glycosyltransferase involved in cell wall biosynthesis
MTRPPIQQPGAEPRRKINLMILTSSLVVGGAETVIKALADSIDRSKFNLTIAFLKLHGPIAQQIAQSGTEIIGLADPSGKRVDYFSFRKVLRLIARKNIEVVHTHTTDSMVDASICKLLRPRLRLVHTFHFGNYPHTRKRILWMERVFARLSDYLIAVGVVQKTQICRVHRLKEEQLRTIWNGVALPESAADLSFRRSLKIGDRLLIGTVATLIEQKGLMDLLKVAERMRAVGYDSSRVVFAVVGGGRLKSQLEAERRRLGLDGSVFFVGSVADAAKRALPSFDIFFQPSLWEAMSIVVLEAMASGKPVVATRVGDNPHVIEHDMNGLLVEPRDINGMASALVKLVDDKRERDRLGTAARLRAEQTFSVRRMTQMYEHVYAACTT